MCRTKGSAAALLLLFLGMFSNVLHAALQDDIEISFGDAPRVEVPLDIGLRHVITVKNVAGERVITEIGLDHQGDYQITLFPQPGLLILEPGETRDFFALITKKDTNIEGEYQAEAGYVFRRYGNHADTFTVPFTYRFAVLSTFPFDDITGDFIVNGTVTDPAGNPLRDAEVMCGLLSSHFSRSTGTPEDGRFSFHLPERDDWYLVVTKNGYRSEYLFNLDEAEDLVIRLESCEAPELDYELAKSVSLDTGFWKQAVSADGQFILLCQGMENWPNPDMKANARLFLYSIDGALQWEHAMGWEAWGADLSKDAKYATYVTNRYPDAELALLDGRTGTEIWRKLLHSDIFPPPADSPFQSEGMMASREVVFSNDASCMAVGTLGGFLYVLNRENGEILWSRFTGGEIRKILFDSNDEYLYAGTGDGYLYKIRVSDGLLEWKDYIASWPYTYGLDLSPDESLIASGGKDGSLYVRKTNTGEEVWHRDMGIMCVRWVDFSPDGRLLAAGSGAPYGTMVFDASDGNPLWRTGFSAVGMFSADGEHLFIGEWYAQFFSPAGTLEVQLDPEIHTGYWKVSFVTRDLSRFVVGARDLNGHGPALAFYKKKKGSSIPMFYLFSSGPAGTH